MVNLNKGATVELVKTLSDDIRIGYDGTEYETAGDAVRGQVGALKQDLINTRIVLDIIPTWHYGYIDKNGLHDGSPSWKYSEPIFIPKNYTVILKADNYNGSMYAISRPLNDGVYSSLQVGSSDKTEYIYTTEFDMYLAFTVPSTSNPIIVCLSSDVINTNKKFTTDNGYLGTGVAGSFIANGGMNPKPEICGFSGGERMTTYNDRDSVALFVKNSSVRPLTIEGCTFETDKVIVPNNIDIGKVIEGNYIDVYDDNNTRYTSIVDSVVGNIINVKYGGFYIYGNYSAGATAPPNDSVVYINRINHIWAVNTVTHVRNDDKEKVNSGWGFEIDIKKDKKIAETRGVVVASLGTYENNIAYDVTGKTSVSYMSRTDSHSAFESRLDRDNKDGKRVLTREIDSGKPTQSIAYIDENFNYHSDQDELVINCKTASMKLLNGMLEVNAIKIGNHILTIDEAGNIVIN